MTVKEMLTNPEVVENIMEDITDIPEDAEVVYSVWALGYDAEEDCTDTEVLLGEFENPDEAVAFAEKITLDDVAKAFEEEYMEMDADDAQEAINANAYFSIEVETVITDPDSEDGGTMNIGSIYQRNLLVEDEDLVDSVVELTNKEYEVLKDGGLKVNSKILKDYNKNDYVNIRFIDEENSWPLNYKIMSKVIYEDGDYYHLDFIG